MPTHSNLLFIIQLETKGEPANAEAQTNIINSYTDTCIHVSS